jgi:hypothetical protein
MNKSEMYRDWVSKNKEIRNEIDRRYRENNKEKVKQRKRDYYLKNKKRILEQTAIWQRSNPEKVKERNARWLLKNPSAKRNFCAHRRAKKKQASVSLTDYDKTIIAVIYDARKRISDCIGIVFHVDHIIPLSKGGIHHQTNLQIISGIANCKKGASL